jgi:hypothetical protein
VHRLNDAIAALVSVPDMGGPRTDTAEFAQMLNNRLRGVLRSNTIYFNLSIALVIVLFVASIVVVTTHLESPALITAALGGFGIGSIGLVGMMLRSWREKTATELLIELAVWFQGDQLRMIVNALHRWMSAPSRGTASDAPL